LRHLRVDVEVTEAEHSSARQEDDWRVARARVVQIEASTAGRVQVAERGQIECIR
jgi:hypothetical protein